MFLGKEGSAGELAGLLAGLRRGSLQLQELLAFEHGGIFVILHKSSRSWKGRNEDSSVAIQAFKGATHSGGTVVRKFL